eukprot:SAG31_NODE_757_length_12296_cov_8.840289_9_plen_335_part_00
MEASHPSGNDCRALNLNEANCDYFARATDSTNNGDLGGILDPRCVTAWTTAMADDKHWHHVAVTDDGTTVTVFLDGQQVAQRKHVLTPQTAAGFQVGGWGDGSRCFDGWLSGVCFYHTTLTEQQVSAVMTATRPKAEPPCPPSRSVLYRGPILLTYDPRLNAYAACPRSLDATGFVSGKMIPSAGGWLHGIQPQLVLEFVVGGKTVRLCDFASAGLTGRDYTSWLPLVFTTSTVPSAPFTKSAPGRTFFMDGVVLATKSPAKKVAIKLHVVKGDKDVEMRRFSIARSRHRSLHDDISAMLNRDPKTIRVDGIVGEDEWRSLGDNTVLRLCVKLT